MNIRQAIRQLRYGARNRKRRARKRWETQRRRDWDVVDFADRTGRDAVRMFRDECDKTVKKWDLYIGGKKSRKEPVSSHREPTTRKRQARLQS